MSRSLRFVDRSRIRRAARDLRDGACDAAQRRAEIGQVDHGQQQPRDPEQMDVGKERQQAENGDDLELQLLRFVRHALGQRVQPQIDVADRQNGSDQDDANDHHQDVRVTRRGDKRGQMMRRVRMKQLAQAALHSRKQMRETKTSGKPSLARVFHHCTGPEIGKDLASAPSHGRVITSASNLAQALSQRRLGVANSIRRVIEESSDLY